MSASFRPRVGLVLGGGGARGLAHVGVLRVLHRAKVPVDLIVGCSMGAMVGTLFAFYQNAEDTEARLRRFTSSPGFARDKFDHLQAMSPIPGEDQGLAQTVRRYYKLGLFVATTLFKPSFISPQQVNRDIEAIIPEGRIEDAPIPLAIVTTDLRSGDEVVLTEGPARLAVQASSAIAGVFPPVAWGDRELVDGGFVNKVPVEIAFRLGADVVIAVDVSSDIADSRDYSGTGSSVGFRATAILSEAFKRVQMRFADVAIRPETSEFHWADFAAIAAVIPRGEEAAERALPEIRKALRRAWRHKMAGALGVRRRWSLDLRTPPAEGREKG